jgi:hypothetical protein
MAEELQAMDEADAGAALDTLFGSVAEKVEEATEEKAERPRGPDGKFLPTKKEENSEEAEPEDASESEEEEAPPPRLVKVKVDGMEVEVDEEELKKGYSRTSDYTKKTQALAEERRKFEAEERAAVRAERQAYAENLARVQEALEVLTPSREPDWRELQGQMTPEEFTKHYASWKANASRLERVREEQERVRSLQEQDDSRARATRLMQEKDRLEEAVPDLKDPEKGKALRQDLMDYAKAIGFSDDDLAAVEDHRPLVLLHKARLWDESQKRRPKVEEKVDRALESLKPTGSKPAPRQKVVDGLKTKLKDSGSLDDAAAYLNTIMGAK